MGAFHRRDVDRGEDLAPTTPRVSRPCSQLPPDARDLLALASQVPDPYERRRAIDHAIDIVKSRHPELFTQE
jgi:hypothetical protein